MLREKLSFAVSMAITVLFSVLLYSTVVGAADKVRIGYVQVFDDAPTLIAEEAKIFEKNGLDTKLTAFTSGTSLVKGLVTGQLDIGVLGFTNVITWNDKGSDLVIVGKQQMGYHALIARNDRNIASLANMKGKTLASQQAGSTADITLKGVLLPSAGLRAADVQMVYTEPATALQSLLSSRVDAAFLFEPFASMALLQGGVRLIKEVSEDWPFPCMVVVTTRKLAANHPEAVRNFLQSNKSAVEFIKNKPDTAADLLAPIFVPQGSIDGPKGPIPGRTVMQKAIASQNFDWRITTADMQRMQQMVGVMVDQSILDSKVDVTKFIDLSWQNALGK